MAIPYIKKVLEKFGRNITKILDLVGIKKRIVFSTVRVGSYFFLNNSISKKFGSCVVYKFTCPGDLDTQYIGETERQPFLRIKKHTTPTNSSVFSNMYMVATLSGKSGKSGKKKRHKSGKVRRKWGFSKKKVMKSQEI